MDRTESGSLEQNKTDNMTLRGNFFRLFIPLMAISLLVFLFIYQRENQTERDLFRDRQQDDLGLLLQQIQMKSIIGSIIDFYLL